LKKKAFVYIVFAGLLWGTSGIFVHFLAPYGFTSLQMTCVRAVVSFICLGGYAFFRDRTLFRIKPRQLLLCIGAGAGIFLTASCYYTAMQMTSVSTAVVLMYTAPVYVAVISALFLGEKFSRLKLVSIVGILIGSILVSGCIGDLKFDLLGILIGVLSGITYAAYNLLTKLALRQGCRAVSVTVYSFGAMAVIAALVCQPLDIPVHAAAAPGITVPLLIGLGICTCVMPYFLYTLSMKELSAGTASALGIVEPMAATVYSVVFFREQLDIFSGSGIALILLSVVLLGKAEDSDSVAKN